MLSGNLLDLDGYDKAALKKLQLTPSSALGSSRLKLKEEHFEPILRTLKTFNIRYFFMIGGNDTMDTIHRVVEYARSTGYEMHGVGIAKTVDNDLFGTDHTPGYPSAARYVALSVQQAGLLARDMQRVDQFVVFQTVGRSAGWLPAAAACAKKDAADPPHIILMPEVPFSYRDSLFPRTEYAEAWKVLQRDLPRRDACRRMVDLLFIAHEQACEAELAHLLAADLGAGRVPEPGALVLLRAPKATALPRDVAVAHPSLDSFDALLGASA